MKCINRSTTLRNSLRTAAVFASLAANAFGGNCVPVAGDRVRAKDLAVVNDWFATLDGATEFGMTPLAGVTRIMRGRELLTLARAAKGTSIPEAFADICVERAARSLTREQLQPVLDAALGGAAIILEFSRYRIPDGSMEFTRAGLAPSGLWRGRVKYGANRSTPIWAAIQWGAPKTKAREVEHGDRVAVEVTSGAARLAFEAVAESAGHAGESILIRNPENGHIFQAQVLEEGKVFIHK